MHELHFQEFTVPYNQRFGESRAPASVEIHHGGATIGVSPFPELDGMGVPGQKNPVGLHWVFGETLPGFPQLV